MTKKSVQVRFGESVTALRKKQGWTQKELAKRSGISRSYLQRIEIPQTPNVTVNTIEKLARELRIGCYKLFRYASV